MKRLTGLIALDKEFSASVTAVREQMVREHALPIVINGLTGGATLAYICEAAVECRRITGLPVLILADGESEVGRLACLLKDAGLTALEYKSRELVFHNISASHDRERERLSVLSMLIGGALDAVVADAAAAAQYTVPRGLLESLVMTLKEGNALSPEVLCEALSSMGFARVELVEAAGQFARRGGIVDFFADIKTGPVRIEFFGDEIDRIAAFDVITQRATARLDSVSLAPAHEVMLSADARDRVKKTVKKLIDVAPSEAVKATLEREMAVLDGTAELLSRDKYINTVYKKKENLFTYFSSLGRCAVLLSDSARLYGSVRAACERVAESVAALADNGLIPRDVSFFAPCGDMEAFLLECITVYVNPFATGVNLGELGGLFGFRCRRCVSYGDNPRMLFEDIKAYKKSGYRTLIQCDGQAGVKSLYDALADEGIAASVISAEEYDAALIKEGGSVMLITGDGEGYELITPRVALLSMERDEGRNIMRQRRRQRILKKAGGAGQRIMSHADLEVGDYVVHANYGIGLFEGIETVRIDGSARDYITIKYAGTDKLFVPCDRLELIGKYIGERDADGKVKLSKMGGTEWHRAKSRAKAAAKDMAKKLINLYAERQRTPGYAFPRDSELEDEFAAAFEYEETESQTVAIEEIKQDMMKPVPMNRLLLGDVGFGKTEVALRAAFKAIMGGKQVAFLVPTTILALQHYQTALTRMRGYPVNVEMLSRFRTPKQQAKIIDAVKRGAVDILIGTHKLLSKNIEFRDLGLLIVDEEQRFGVAQKERLKEMAASVDVLTLSATPIPRTLNMAMNGISDMSVLDEAPEDRRPVQTYVLEHDDGIIEDAMRREIARGGQVLYLYNKVESIDLVAGRIMRAIPEARVAVAHGQMEKDELEDIWQALVATEIDILVCTTIIETGVDLPSANTLIIENADRMGLSQLHQIRGRVGRSQRQAYAYFTYRPGKALSEVAEKRLSAIKEYAEFGAGFKVALRDLEIRGAGNLLGAEQHGYIDSVGYDLYVKLLNEAVLEERGEAPAENLFSATVDFKIDAHIPEYYIASSAGRMEMYKKISLIASKSDADEIYDELTDRYGDVPKTVERLLRISLGRALLSRAEIESVSLSGATMIFKAKRLDLPVWAALLNKHRGRLYATSSKTAPLSYKLMAGEDVTRALCDIMTEYHEEAKL